MLSPGYSASSKVLLKGQPDKNQLLTETQIAMSLVVLDHVADDLKWGTRGIDLQGAVTATVSDGNVIEIAGIAATPDRARALTDAAAAEYVAASTQILNDTRQASEGAERQRHDAAQKRVDDLRAQLATAQDQPVAPDAAAETDRLTGAVSAAQAELAEIDRQSAQRQDQPSSSGTATVLEKALDRGRAAPTPVQLVVGCAVAGAALGLYALLWSGRRGGRLTRDDQIAAALGAPVLANVTVASADLHDGDRTGGVASRQGRLAKLLGDGRDEAVPEVDPQKPGETVRYRRALTRIGGTTMNRLRLVIVVPEDDQAAQVAVAVLAQVAATDRGPVRIVADDLGTAELYRRLIGSNQRVSVTRTGEDESGDTVFRVVGVTPSRPTVPDALGDSGVLVVMGVGMRTAGELIDIAGACSMQERRWRGPLW